MLHMGTIQIQIIKQFATLKPKWEFPKTRIDWRTFGPAKTVALPDRHCFCQSRASVQRAISKTDSKKLGLETIKWHTAGNHHHRPFSSLEIVNIARQDGGQKLLSESINNKQTATLSNKQWFWIYKPYIFHLRCSKCAVFWFLHSVSSSCHKTSIAKLPRNPYKVRAE